MANFEILLRFYIDNGELDKLTKQQAFVLGYEFCSIFAMIETRQSFNIQFHSDNEERVRKMLADQNVTEYKLWVDDDWPVLEVVFSKEVTDGR